MIRWALHVLPAGFTKSRFGGWCEAYLDQCVRLLESAAVPYLAENLKLLAPANFIAPWLAHALGTLVAAFVAAKVAASRKMTVALGISVFFLLGGIVMVVMFGGPIGFIVLDLIGAYLPMGFLGGMLGGAKQPQPA